MVTLSLTDQQARALARASDLAINLLANLIDRSHLNDSAMADAHRALLSACERAGVQVEATLAREEN